MIFKRKIEKYKYLSANFLFIHINRIFIDKKITKNIDVPLKLKLKENKRNLYLRSIIVHHGGSNGGHYTTMIECKGTWYHFDDMNSGLDKIGDYEDLKKYQNGYVFKNCTDLVYI